MIWTRHFILVLVLVSSLSFACDSRRQLRTFTDLQGVSRAVKMETPEGERVTRETIGSEIRTWLNEDGHDVWGNEIIYIVREDDWVLISPGADRELDFESMEQYFLMKTEDIRGQPDRDIVFRNGKHVTYAGK